MEPSKAARPALFGQSGSRILVIQAPSDFTDPDNLPLRITNWQFSLGEHRLRNRTGTRRSNISPDILNLTSRAAARTDDPATSDPVQRERISLAPSILLP